jgi:hypothetical protein
MQQALPEHPGAAALPFGGQEQKPLSLPYLLLHQIRNRFGILHLYADQRRHCMELIFPERSCHSTYNFQLVLRANVIKFDVAWL